MNGRNTLNRNVKEKSVRVFATKEKFLQTYNMGRKKEIQLKEKKQTRIESIRRIVVLFRMRRTRTGVSQYTSEWS